MEVGRSNEDASSPWRIAVCDVAVIRGLRHEVLRPGLPPDTAVFEGDDEPTTLHWAAWADGQVIGCVTVVRRDSPEGRPWQLRGMATAAAWRGRGVGAALLRAVHRRMTGQPLWCNARREAVGFYQRHGWRCVSEEFDVPTVGPHRRMAGPG